MHKKLLNASLLTAMLFSALALTGCDDDDVIDIPAVKQGQFLDSAVQNIDVYQNSKKISTTDKEGKYVYLDDSAVTFKVGKLTLGTSEAKDIVTPADFSKDTNVVTKVLQVLQSLDDDNKPENGIFIKPTVIEQLKEADLSQEAVTAETVLMGVVNHIVKPEQAIQHFAQSNDKINKSIELSKATDKLVGFWQKDCQTKNGQGIVEVYQFKKVANQNNKLEVAKQLEKKYNDPQCKGLAQNPAGDIKTSNLEVTVMGVKENVMNVLVKDSNGIEFLPTTLHSDIKFTANSKTYSRLNSLKFDDFAKEKVVLPEGLEQAVDKVIASGHLDKYFQNLDVFIQHKNDITRYHDLGDSKGEYPYVFYFIPNSNTVQISQTKTQRPNTEQDFNKIAIVKYQRQTIKNHDVIWFNIPQTIKNDLVEPRNFDIYVQVDGGIKN